MAGRLAGSVKPAGVGCSVGRAGWVVIVPRLCVGFVGFVGLWACGLWACGLLLDTGHSGNERWRLFNVLGLESQGAVNGGDGGGSLLVGEIGQTGPGVDGG